jgi:hypothetical protein
MEHIFGKKLENKKRRGRLEAPLFN